MGLFAEIAGSIDHLRQTVSADAHLLDARGAAIQATLDAILVELKKLTGPGRAVSGAFQLGPPRARFDPAVTPSPPLPPGGRPMLTILDTFAYVIGLDPKAYKDRMGEPTDPPAGSPAYLAGDPVKLNLGVDPADGATLIQTGLDPATGG